jgi:hypothetical protein
MGTRENSDEQIQIPRLVCHRGAILYTDSMLKSVPFGTVTLIIHLPATYPLPIALIG